MNDAIQRMRDLTKIGVPFSFSYVSFNDTDQISEGYKTVDGALLRKSMVNSTKSELLIEYELPAENKKRRFYLPLLITFNETPVRL